MPLEEAASHPALPVEEPGNGTLRVAFAGDRAIAAAALSFLLDRPTTEVVFLAVSDAPAASHADELISLAGLPPSNVAHGNELNAEQAIAVLRRLGVHYLLSVHYPHLVRRSALSAPTRACLNLHPAYLPFNRGWHTPSWSILDGTPAGATLHVMTEALDAGDIVAQRQVPVRPGDTAHSLYQRILEAELELFTATWPMIESGELSPAPQDLDQGTSHWRSDLFDPAVQRLDLSAVEPIGRTLDRLRALTTNRPDEACFFEIDGVRYHVRVEITSDDQR